MVVIVVILLQVITSCLGNEEYITVLNQNPQSNVDTYYQCYTPTGYTDYILSYGRSFSVANDESLDEKSWTDVPRDNPRRYVVEDPVGMGVYYWKIVNNDDTTVVQTIKIRDDALITPGNSKNTVTVNVGDDVTIRFNTHLNSNLAWNKDGFNNIQVGTEKSMTFDQVETSNAGVYEMYEDGNRDHRRHAFIKLIVRACPHQKWGPPDCTGECEYCYNGGVCDDKTGFCICAPGFSGSTCETECGGNKHGWNCEHFCTQHDDLTACKDKQFCLPDPYGCSCVTGYKGLKCNTECSSGTFGADCAQTCHCKQGGCNRYTGICTDTQDSSCAFPWKGTNCQECQSKRFGENCDIDCTKPCECHRLNGKCIQGTCFSGFLEPNCVPTYDGSLIANASSSSITIEWTPWSTDNGEEDLVIGYFLYHKLSNTDDWKKEFFNTSLSGTVTRLIVDTHYTLGVSAMRAGEEGEGPIGGIITVTTLCGKPSPVENVKLQTPSNTGIIVTWIGKLDAESLKCSTAVFDYRVYLKVINNKGYREEVYQTKTNQFKIENVEVDDTYAILVTVSNKDSESEPVSILNVPEQGNAEQGTTEQDTAEQENANGIIAGGAAAAGVCFGVIITIMVTICKQRLRKNVSKPDAANDPQVYYNTASNNYNNFAPGQNQDRLYDVTDADYATVTGRPVYSNTAQTSEMREDQHR
ncbi:uncharacterized protein [Antedon mediterranea]|uniref:uncharacterized protein n=1 Tax=Antedon mediterranea TaxID=105859 RepID=UPI003AF7926F